MVVFRSSASSVVGELALGLMGQDFYLAPYMLGQDRSFTDNRQVIATSDAFQESGLAGEWATGVSDHFCERWPDYIELDDGDGRLHASFPARSLTVWSVGRVVRPPFPWLSSHFRR